MTSFRTNTKRSYAKRAFPRTRTGLTFPPELVEAARKLAIGRRLAEARERSRWTQENIADHLTISTRAWQKVEQKGTTSYERCEIVAEFVEVPGVTAAWLYEGRGPGPGEYGDPLDALSPPISRAELDDRLEWIESALHALLADRGLELDAQRGEPDRQPQTGSSAAGSRNG